MARALRARAPAASLIAASRSAFRARRRGRCAGQPLAAIAASRYALGADGMGALRARAPAAARSRPRAARSAPMAWARPPPPPGDEAIATTTRGVGVDAATASEPRHAWGPVEDATARREPHRTAQVRRSSDQRTACGANHLVEGGKLCTSTKQAGCLIPDLLDLRVHERLGWRESYPASIFDMPPPRSAQLGLA